VNASTVVLYFLISAAVAAVVGVYTGNRRGPAVGVLWGALVLVLSGLGVALWAVWFGLTSQRRGA